MRRILLLISSLLFLLSTKPVAAQHSGGDFAPGSHARFEHMTIDDGISQNAGLAFLQDNQGYLWFGTQDGLDRYDGYKIVEFKNDPENENSLSSNSIISLFQDKDGFIWIGTWGGGLNRYNPVNGEFIRYLYDPEDVKSISDPVVTDVYRGEDGVVWIATLGGLDRLDPSTSEIIHFRNSPTDQKSLSSNAVSMILPAEDGKFWVGTGAFNIAGAGLNLFDPATGEFQRMERSGNCLASPNISDVVKEKDNSIWIAYGGYGVSGGGLDHYYPNINRCTHFDTGNNRNAQFTDSNVTDLLIDHNGLLWATSWSGGLWRYSSGSQFDNFTHNPADPESLSSDSAFSIYEDRSGVIWVGTLGAGINKLNLDTLQFNTYRNDPSNPSSLPSDHVGSFAQTTDGSIWVGIWESGLARFIPKNGTFIQYKTDPSNPESISSDLVATLLADPDGTLWVGTLGNGLDNFDPKTETFTHYANIPDDSSSLADNQVATLFFDTKGRLWVGSFSGLARFDSESKTFINYQMPAPAVSFASIGNELWIGTWGSGILRLDLSIAANLKPDSAEFSTLLNNPDDPNSLVSNGVWSIIQSPDGLIWLGTEGGLNRYDLNSNQFKVYSNKDGLRNSTILGMLMDKSNKLWLLTNNGLAKFNPSDESFQIFDKSDGLQGNEYNSNAYMQDRNGIFYVGGVGGFSKFDPLSVAVDVNPPEVAITNFSIFNQPQAFDLSGSTPIQLAYNQNFISFDFTAFDYQSPKNNLYSYKLEGFDKDWSEPGTRNYANYTNLPGGDYVFRVRAANSKGVWNNEGSTLNLKVVPPVWKTWQFRIWMIIIVSVIIYLALQFRFQSIRNQNIQLQKVVEEQQRVEQELRLSEERFRAMFENAAIGISLISADGKPLAVNPVLVRLSGRSESELIELGGQGTTYPEDINVGRQEFSEVISGKRDSYQVEKRYVHKDGRIHWIRQSISAVRDTNGITTSMVVIAEDIDDGKKAIEKLRESEARFKAVFEYSAVGMGMTALDGTIIDVNPAMCEMLGYSREELIGQTPESTSCPEDYDALKEQYRKIIDGEITHYIAERRYIRKNGTVFWIKISNSMIRDENGNPKYTVGIVEDIDEQKRAAEKLAAQEIDYRQKLEQKISERTEELNNANELLRVKSAQDAVTAERTRLARDLHDAVTQTLFSTTLIADVLPDIWAMNQDEGRKRLEEIRQLTRGALAEMRTLLVELRPNALVEVPLPTLLRQLTEALIGRSRMTIQLNTEGERKLPPEVQVSFYRLAQEALNNVVKHAKASQAVVTLRLGDSVRLTVEDNGVGFDQSTVTADHLGLKIMRERSEAIGAKLKIYSEPGDGTQISIIWP